MTRIDPDDPKWTAYVLGELSDSERAAVELELESSEDARTLVEELRFAADMTKAELREYAQVLPLTTQEKEAIRASAGAGSSRRWFTGRPVVWATAGLAAASIALIAVSVSRPPSSPIAAVPAETKRTKPPAEADQAEAVAKLELRYEQAASLERKDKPAQEASASATGRVFGTVQDGAAAAVPGAAIIATNTRTGAASATVTNESGSYSLDGLKPGTYKVTGSLPGFNTSDADVQVAANNQAQRDITLQVARVAANVEVKTSAAPTGQIADNFKEPLTIPNLAANQQDEREIQQQGQAQLSQQEVRTIPSPPAFLAPGARGALEAPPAALDKIVSGSLKGAEAFDGVNDNPFLAVGQNQLSAFPLDVDTGSYLNLARSLDQNQLPSREAVRIEEMINYFAYDYPQPAGNNPVGATIEAAAAPWNPQHRLVRVGIKARGNNVDRVFANQIGAAPITVAKDVTAQVEFNPAVADAYRLIGYENRALGNAAVKNDLKPAGDMEAGQAVTVLYEIVPRVQPPRSAADAALTLKIRYKEPAGAESKLLEVPLVDRGQAFDRASADFRFTAAVASFGMILRNSPYKGTATIGSVLRIAADSVGPNGSVRRQFLQLVQRAGQVRGER